jgi:hypothetical protein
MVKLFSVVRMLNERKNDWWDKQCAVLFRYLKIVELVILFYIIISDEISTFQHFHKCRKLIFFSFSKSNLNRNKNKKNVLIKKKKSWPTIIDTCVLIQLIILIFDENQRNGSAPIVLRWRRRRRKKACWNE